MSHELPPEHGVTSELAELVEKFYLEALNEPENRRLNDLLRQDDKARSFLLAYGSIHARLSWEYGPTLADKPLALFGGAAEESSSARSNRPHRNKSGFLWWIWGSLLRRLLGRREDQARFGKGVAPAEPCFPPRPTARQEPRLPNTVPRITPGYFAGAVTALALVLGMLLWTNSRPTQPAPLAVVTRCLGVQTADSRGAIRPGQSLGPGRLSIDAGTVEVTIQNGARIVLEGPATVELLTPKRAYLLAGQAVVHVPKTASGFVIETRDANVLDLGTEFGVKVGPGRGTEVQVYRGSVFTSAKSAGGRTNNSQRMLAGTAARLDPNATDTFQNLPFAPDRFVRQLPETKSSHQDTLPLSNQPSWDRVEIVPASEPIVADGKLSEWDRQTMFRSQCEGTEDYGVEGAMMYDANHLYVGAHVADPAPLRNLIDPVTDGDMGWKGGGLQVRLSTDRAVGWPVDANAEVYYQGQPVKQRPQDLNEKLVHLTLWHHAPSQKDCLHISYGMNFHGGQTNPSGYRAAFRKDADGRGYTLEYAIPWELLNAQRDPPRAGDTLAVTWTVHWSDQSGRRWRGQLVEIRNPSEPPRNNNWDRAAGWGQANFR